MTLFTLEELEAAAHLVHAHVPPTPQFAWPLLRQRTGVEVWVKHENHTPTGAFKVRGGIVYMDWLKHSGLDVSGVISATRGNHGQSIAAAAARVGLPCVIVVPEGNSVEKNAAMQAFGAELITHGSDFDAAKAHAAELAKARNLHFVPSFDKQLVMGVATYALELFRAVPDIARVYVPIGLGSGICGVIAVRDLLGLKTEVVGVVADAAAAYALSLEAGHVVSTNTAATFADGMAVRVPNEEAFAMIKSGVSHILRLTDDEIADAIRIYYRDTHNLAEGAGAAPLAGLMRERTLMQGQKAAVILCGGNIDAPVFSQVLTGNTPKA
ncbi:MAG: threonine dehydratase [Hyphomicrobiaceae bacterium]